MRALLREKISRGEQKMRGEGMVGSVELRVSEDSEEILVYTFKTAREAGEMVRFLSEFLPNARFLVQPLTH